MSVSIGEAMDALPEVWTLPIPEQELHTYLVVSGMNGKMGEINSTISAVMDPVNIHLGHAGVHGGMSRTERAPD